MHGQAASSNKEAAEKFVVEFSDVIKKEDYLPRQIFNADEKGLFWKNCQTEPVLQRSENHCQGTNQ